MSRIRQILRALYVGGSPAARTFQYSLAAFDVLILIYIVASSFFPREPWMHSIDLVFGVGAMLELGLRLWAAKSFRSEFFHPQTAIDIVVIFSLLAPVIGLNFAFLRALRITRVRPWLLPWTCPRVRASSPSTRRPRRASSKAAAAPIPPSPNTITS
jgi:voltage-gated potassium channel